MTHRDELGYRRIHLERGGRFGSGENYDCPSDRFCWQWVPDDLAEYLVTRDGTSLDTDSEDQKNTGSKPETDQ